MTTTTHKFDSIQALAAAARDTTAAPGAGDTSQHNWNEEFYGHVSFDEAVEMGLAGGCWNEGAKDVKTMTTGEPEHGHAKPRRKPVNGYAANRPNVPRYLAGSQRHMTKQTPAPTTKKVLRMAVHVGRYAAIEQRHAVNRGAAILSVIHDLEADGHSVEVVACWRNNSGTGGTTVSIETIIKPAGAFFSPADCAFALCHVAFQRRLCWRIAEGDELANPLTSQGYGNGRSERFKDFDLHTGYMGTKGPWSSVEKARKHIADEVAQQLAANNQNAA